MKFLNALVRTTLIMNAFVSFGQMDTDSLWKVWSDKKQSDRIRLYSIHALATDSVYQNEIDSILYYTKLQYDFAQITDNKEYLAKARYTQGQSYLKTQEYQSALNCFVECAQIRFDTQLTDDLEALFNEINNVFIKSKKIQEGIDYSLAWLKRIEQSEDDSDQIEILRYTFLFNLGILHRHQSNYDLAISKLEMANAAAEKLERIDLLTQSFFQYANMYFYKGNYAAAIEHYTRTLEYAERSNNKVQNLYISFNLAVIYYYLEEYDNALKKYNSAENLLKQYKDTLSLIQVYNNKADIFVVKKNFTKAFENYNLGLNLAKKIENRAKIALIYTGMGEALMLQKQYEAAKTVLNKSISICEAIDGDKRIFSMALQIKGLIAFEQKEYAQAIKFGNLALNMSQSIGSMEIIEISSELLYKTYKKTDRFQDALKMHELYINSRDSLNSDKNQRALIRQEYKYEYEQKAYIDSLEQAKELVIRDGQALLKDLQIKKKKRQNQFLLVILLLAFLATLFFFYRFHTIKRQKAIIGKQRLKILTNLKKMQEKSLRQQMNPHFIFNAINNIQYFMFLKGERETNKYIVYFSKLIRYTLDMSTSDHTVLRDEIDYLKSYMELEKMRLDGNLELDFKVSESLNINEIKIPCMLLQPIVENAIKHGLKPKKSDRKLSLSFSTKDQMLDIVITDNGIGREATLNWNVPIEKKHRSWATFILKERIKIFNFEKERALKFKIVDLKDGDRSLGTQVSFSIPLEH